MRYTYLFEEILISQWSKYIPRLNERIEIKIFHCSINECHLQLGVR